MGGQLGVLLTVWKHSLTASDLDGGKWVCGMSRIAKKPDCVVYSFGINGESSFEAEVLDRTECQLWGYDFSVSDVRDLQSDRLVTHVGLPSLDQKSLDDLSSQKDLTSTPTV